MFTNIGTALNGGDPTEAERLSRDVLARTPDHVDALLALALSLHAQYRTDEALGALSRLTQIQPDSGVHWSNYAKILAEAGHAEESEAAWRRAMACDPDDPEPRIQLGQMLVARKEYAAARDMLLDAFERDREAPRARILAARACALALDFRGCEDLLAAWRTWLPLDEAALQVELARYLLLLADAPGAQFALQELLAREPDVADARILLARVEERLNLLDEAQAVLQPLDAMALSEPVRRQVNSTRALLALRQGDPGRARTLLEQSGPTQDADYPYWFELASVCDKLGDAAAAMHALAEGHARQIAEFRHAAPDIFAADALPLPGAVRTITPEEFARWPSYRAPDSRDSPIIVVGFPRSGTTLLEQMLDAHPRLQSMDETPFFERLAGKLRAHDPRILDDLSVLRQYDCDELRKRYFLLTAERIARRADTQLVDKNPLNMLWLPMIYRLFPAAKFILCVRHPCDVILSCYMQNFRSAVLGAACENLERLARAYVQAMHTWLQHASVIQPDVLVSRYEDLVADTPAQTRRIANHLDLDDATPMLRFDAHAREKVHITTPSYSQVIEPVNARALGRWQRYREWFEPVLPILQPMLDHWGYSTDRA
ncbi:MAG: sulfotransferase [Proteobacteria bacterium]|nr:sulfotransferase [Pseudomonadota bacterium]